MPCRWLRGQTYILLRSDWFEMSLNAKREGREASLEGAGSMGYISTYIYVCLYHESASTAKHGRSVSTSSEHPRAGTQASLSYCLGAKSCKLSGNTISYSRRIIVLCSLVDRCTLCALCVMDVSVTLLHCFCCHLSVDELPPLCVHAILGHRLKE